MWRNYEFLKFRSEKIVNPFLCYLQSKPERIKFSNARKLFFFNYLKPPKHYSSLSQFSTLKKSVKENNNNITPDNNFL